MATEMHYMTYCGNHGIPSKGDWKSALKAAADCLGTSPVAEVTIHRSANEFDVLLSGCELVRAGVALEFAERGFTPDQIYAQHGHVE